MAQLAQLAQGEGNTRTPPKKARAWLMVWNNYSEENLAWMAQWAQHNCKEYRINQEIGEKEHTPHLQMALYLNNARTWDSMKKLFPTQHMQMAESWKKVKNYSSKEKTRIPGTVCIKEGGTVRDPLAGKELWPFQKEVLARLKSPADDRTIHWFWEPTGCTGKTTLVKSICINHEDAIFVSGKAGDMKCAIATMIKEKCAPKIVLLGLPRTAEDFTGSLYQGLEEIKDGVFFSGKYESGMVLFDSPHVMVFANWPPDMTKLSTDRWNVREIRASPAVEPPIVKF